MFERYVNFDFYKTKRLKILLMSMFERYVNFDFYKTEIEVIKMENGLRDM